MTPTYDWFCLPRELAEWPPIRHRHSDPESTDVTPFEFAILAGVLVEARCLILGAERHQAAFARGGEKIEQEKQLHDDWRDDWKYEKQERRRQGKKYISTPERRHTFEAGGVPSTYNAKKPMPLKQALKRAGADGYEYRSRALSKQPAPETIAIDTTRFELLRCARINVDGPRMRKVEAALDRLLEPIGLISVPLLQGWTWLESGRLELQVAGRWLDPRFVKLPLPLPLRSPTALAILMFLMTIVNRACKFPKEGKILFESLCTRFGIPTWDGNKVAKRSMDNALNILNFYLESDVCKVEFIKLRALPNNYVRFQQGERPQTVTEDEDESKAETESAEQEDEVVESAENAEQEDEVESAESTEIEPSLSQLKINVAKRSRDQQVETENKPRPPRPRITLLIDEEIEEISRQRRVKNDRDCLADLIGPDDAAKLSDQAVTSYLDRLYSLPKDKILQLEHDLRYETERKARLAANKANV